MLARDVMTTSIISAGPDVTVTELAKCMLENRISGVPVVDDGGKLLGIVTEGDLMRRPDLDTARQRSWWLALFGDVDRTSDYIKGHGQRARDVMTKDVVTVQDDAPVGEIAAVLETNRIKRVPVMRAGKVVGVVSRANLLHALITPEREQKAAGTDAEIRIAMIDALREAGLQTHLTNVVVADGIVRVHGFVRSTNEKDAIRVAADNIAGVSGLTDDTAVSPEVSYGY